MRYILDTNVLLDFLMQRDDRKHVACVEVMKRVKNGEIKVAILSVVVAELAWVLGSVYGANKEEVVKSVRVLTKMKGVRVVESYLWEKICGEYAKKKVKFVDAMIAGIRQVAEKKWTVITHDKDFDKLGVLNIMPEEL